MGVSPGTLISVDGAAVVDFYGSFSANKEINLLMEYMDGGSLDRVLQNVGRLCEDVVGTVSLHVLRGLLYLQDTLHVRGSGSMEGTRECVPLAAGPSPLTRPAGGPP